jgi:cyclophilin family peptidyl-prolyl cis-trans isomerase
MLSRLTLALLLSLFLSAAASGQAENQPPPADPPATGQPPAATDPAADPKAEFEKQFSEWKALLVRMRELQVEFPLAKPENQEALLKEWNEWKAKGTGMLESLTKSAEAAYLASPNTDNDLNDLLGSMVRQHMQLDQNQEAIRLGKVLETHNFPRRGILGLIATAAFKLDEFDVAEEYFTKGDAAKVLDAVQVNAMKETRIRKAEMAADDLPRVLLKTTKGDVTLELFENEAPNTVANFISLVEKKFYDGVVFHRVLEGFMAQGGDPKGTGEGGPGYTIKDECTQPNYRAHFRGSLSMAKTSAPNTGGSQFFICYVPTTHLDGQHTVFGRVLSGMEVADSFTRINPEEDVAEKPTPDKIIEATVIRKRNHEYVPETIAE